MADLTTRSRGARDRHPCLALPFTVLSGVDQVRLVAGEDHRYTLRAPGLERWLPALLARLDGSRPLPALLAEVPEPERAAAAALIDRLYGERLLFDGPPEERAAAGTPHRLEVSGDDPLRQAVQAAGAAVAAGPTLRVLCQQRLDLLQALRFGRERLWGQEPALWVSSAALGRGYVSPVLLPGGAPCLRCLFTSFQRLSPLPEVYDELQAHGRRGGALPALPFPAPATAMLAQLVRWKQDLLAAPRPSPALFRLHVLEVDTLTVESHALRPDPECPQCGDSGDGGDGGEPDGAGAT